MEALLINKLINYTKFKSVDFDSTFISCSPLLNFVVDKVYAELVKDSRLASTMVENPKVLDYPEILDILKRRIEFIEDWGGMNFESKRELLEIMAYPYILENSTIKEIIEAH